jgi:hypothetical protein
MIQSAWKLRRIILVLSIFLSGFGDTRSGSSEEPKFNLSAYIDLDLRKLEKGHKAELMKTLAAILPEYRAGGPWNGNPWYIWKKDGGKGLIVFEGYHCIIMPGSSGATVHFLDNSGKLRRSMEFSTGWRIEIESARLRPEHALRGVVLEVRSAPLNNGRDVCRQVYGLLDDRLALLWLEDSLGNFIPNIYEAPNHTIGPDALIRSAKQWEEALACDQPMVVLEALAWLGGEHRRNLSPVDFDAEKVEEARLVASVRTRTRARKILDDLSRSAIKPIQQAARLALKQVDR